ncbi:UBP1-associated protein 2A-like [Lycium barbarum]|uniref:UBP1-associated protein 2A-like n=1 Tax=Lycium barbarum TaxID=112863 RepID=UPI00293E807F|nr:UBP1-associated protein 2A-like [Lycium barbarum]
MYATIERFTNVEAPTDDEFDIRANDHSDESDSDILLDHTETDDDHSSDDDGHSYEDITARSYGNVSYHSNAIPYLDNTEEGPNDFAFMRDDGLVRSALWDCKKPEFIRSVRFHGEKAKDVVHDEEEEEKTLEKLLEPFSKDQLTKLIKQVIAKNPNSKVHIQKLADKDSTHRKIFVYGLGWDTTAETLTSVFEKYGEIEACNAVTDKVSGKSKGYGFILFKHRSSARKALREPQKKIGTRTTSCQLASAGPVAVLPDSFSRFLGFSEYTQRKVFVSNVAADLDPQKLLEFFSKFVEVEEGPLGFDKQTGKPKGFCLFVYRSVESAKKALEEPHKSFEGHILHCQKAIDGPKHSKQQQHYQRPAKKGKYSGSSGGAASASAEHLMAPAGSAIVGFNPAVAGVTPALGQALIALLAMHGAASLGMGNWYPFY